MMMMRYRSSKTPQEIEVVVQQKLNELFNPATMTRKLFTQMFAIGVFTWWHVSFVAKSLGNVDEFGDKWHPLSERRIKEKLTGVRVIGNRVTVGSPSLALDRIGQWVHSTSRLVMNQFRAMGMNRRQALARTNRMYWGMMNAARNVPINVDTSRLEKSIGPAGNEYQIEEDHGPSILLGTNVVDPDDKNKPYARSVQAQRRYLPEANKAKIWVRRATAVGARVLAEEIGEAVA